MVGFSGRCVLPKGQKPAPNGEHVKPYIKQVAIPVRNQDRSLQFYTKKLGFEVVTDVPMGDQRWIELRTPGHEGFRLSYRFETNSNPVWRAWGMWARPMPRPASPSR